MTSSGLYKKRHSALCIPCYHWAMATLYFVRKSRCVCSLKQHTFLVIWLAYLHLWGPSFATESGSDDWIRFWFRWFFQFLKLKYRMMMYEKSVRMGGGVDDQIFFLAILLHLSLINSHSQNEVMEMRSKSLSFQHLMMNGKQQDTCCDWGGLGGLVWTFVHSSHLNSFWCKF